MRLDLAHRGGGPRSVSGAAVRGDITLRKKGGVPIMATRAKPEVSAMRFKVGDRVAVGLTSFSLLPNYTLARQR